jgi:predicted N-acetyltransferase YhbS
METIIRADTQLSQDEFAQMDRLCNLAFGCTEEQPFIWGLRNDWHIFIQDDGIFVSHVGISLRTGTVAGQPVRMGGIGAVATLPSMQGRGLAGIAMKRTAELLRDPLAVDFGLLLCAPEREHFYGSLGWVKVTAPLYYEGHHGRELSDSVTMILPALKQDWPVGEIDLCGLPW